MEGEDTTVNGDVGFDAAMGLGSKAKLPELNEADAEEERETDEREQRWKSERKISGIYRICKQIVDKLQH